MVTAVGPQASQLAAPFALFPAVVDQLTSPSRLATSIVAPFSAAARAVAVLPDVGRVDVNGSHPTICPRMGVNPQKPKTKTKSDKADLSRLSDAELVAQLAERAKQLGIEIDLNYRFLKRDGTGGPARTSGQLLGHSGHEPHGKTGQIGRK